MFRLLMNLMRGSAAQAAEDLADRNALPILDQQIRDAARATDRAKRALALALAQDGQEQKRFDIIVQEIADLETRIIAALEAGSETLAREGADAVAALEAERDASSQARNLFLTEIERLRTEVRQAESRLSGLDRGRRIARAAEAVRELRKGRIDPATSHQSTLDEAEKTLARLRAQQEQAQVADKWLDVIDSAAGPQNVAEKMAECGFGPRLKPNADDVLSRLRIRAQTRTAA